MLLQGWQFSSSCPVLGPLLTCPTTAVLYPGDTAQDLDLLAREVATAPTTLLILDGTWHQARKIWTGSPCLHGVRRVKLCLSSESEYVVRSQPRAGCLSTLECAAHSLARLEGRPEVVDQLLAPLRAMCNSQIHHGGRQGHPSTFVTENNQYRKRKQRYTAGHTTDDSKDLSLQIELEETGDLELACVS